MLLFLLSGRKRKRKGGKERGEKGTEGRKKKEREREKEKILLVTHFPLYILIIPLFLFTAKLFEKVKYIQGTQFLSSHNSFEFFPIY